MPFLVLIFELDFFSDKRPPIVMVSKPIYIENKIVVTEMFFFFFEV